MLLVYDHLLKINSTKTNTVTFVFSDICTVMTELEKLRSQLKFHLEKVNEHQTAADRLSIAIEVLENIDSNDSVNTLTTTKTVAPETSQKSEIKSKAEPTKEFNPDWTHFKKVAFFISSLNRFVFPSEIEDLYKKHGLNTDLGIVNQTLLSMKTKGILVSYKPTEFTTRAHAWGKPEWMGANNKPIDRYKPIEQKKDIWLL